MKTKKYVEYMVEETKKILAIDSPSGYTADVADYVMKAYQKLGYEPKLTTKGGVLVALGGKDKKNAVMLEAHIDTLGAMVAEIKSNGRLRVTPVGGMNANNAEAENCRIHTRFGEKVYEGTLQLAMHRSMSTAITMTRSVHLTRRRSCWTRRYIPERTWRHSAS